MNNNSQLQRFFETAADQLDDAGDVGVRSLVRRGYDVNNSAILAPTSDGKGYPVAPASALELAGQAGDGARMLLSTKYEAAWSKWFARSLRHPATTSGDSAYAGLTTYEKNALSAGVGDAGGFLLPSGMVAELLSRSSAAGVIRRQASIIPTLFSSTEIPAISPNTDNPEKYATDWLALWSPETPLEGAGEMSFESMVLATKRCRTPVLKLSNDLIDDSLGSALSWIIETGSRDLAAVEDAAFVLGDGLANQPRGILSSAGANTLVSAGGMTVDVEGTSSDTISNTTANAGSATKIQSLITSLPGQYRGRARFVANETIEGKIRGLVAADGTQMFRRPTLDSFPLDISPFVPSDGTDGNQVLIYGDLSAYLIATRSLQVHVMRVQYLAENRTGVLISERLGAGLWNESAIRIGVV